MFPFLLEPISKMRLRTHGGVAPPKRHFTSIFMNIKDYTKILRNCLDLNFSDDKNLAEKPIPD
jgi:hypothetical protein